MWKYLVIGITVGWTIGSLLTFALFAVPAGAEIQLGENTIPPAGRKGESITVDTASRVGVKFEELDFISKTIDVEETIKTMAAEHGVNEETALRIAWCESRFDPRASNYQSTAKGVYQFLDGTWEWIGASGHQFDAEENIRQFMKFYPKYPQWWECKG